MHTLFHPALNCGEASDWLRPTPCQREGDKLPKGAYQSGDGYSTRVHLPEHLACVPSSRRESSHVSSQGKEVASVTHDIYNIMTSIMVMHSLQRQIYSIVTTRITKPILVFTQSYHNQKLPYIFRNDVETMPHAMYFSGSKETIVKINQVPYQIIEYDDKGIFR